MCIKDREDIIKFSDVTDIVCIINSNFDGTDGDIQQSIDLYHLIPQDKIKISAEAFIPKPYKHIVGYRL
jgi:hypothetical protein